MILKSILKLISIIRGMMDVALTTSTLITFLYQNFVVKKKIQ